MGECADACVIVCAISRSERLLSAFIPDCMLRLFRWSAAERFRHPTILPRLSRGTNEETTFALQRLRCGSAGRFLFPPALGPLTDAPSAKKKFLTVFRSADVLHLICV